MISSVHHLLEEPIATFAILLAVILVVPFLAERIKLPGLVGLLIAGLVLGPHGLSLLDPDGQIMHLLSDIGLLYLMFVAGLEIDMGEFQKMKYRAAGFGSLTFFLPLLAGVGLGLALGLSVISALLLGSLIASHSLLTYPIISEYNVERNPAVVTTLGATIFTDIGALIVLAICVSAGTGDFTLGQLGTLLVGLAIYALVVLVGFDRLGHFFFERSGDNQGNQFLFILLAVFIAAIGAEVIGVEKIVGAFLVGLAVNEVVGNSLVKEKIVFVGNVLFIPIFFIDVGLLVDLPAFFSSVRVLMLSLSILVLLLVSKFLAAYIAQRLYQFRRQEMLTMWGMSLPQVATTLAAALVGNQAGLLSDDILNAVVVMMLVTALAGPLLVKQTARSLSVPDDEALASSDSGLIPHSFQYPSFNAIVPVCNPDTEQWLLEMAALFADDLNGVIKPLAIAPPRSQMDSPRMDQAFQVREALLNRATAITAALDVTAEPLLRIDQDVARGICHAAREQRSSLILMGWSDRISFSDRLFGSLIDKILWSAHCPVAITRLLQSPQTFQSILVPIKQFTPVEIRKVQLALTLARHNQARITLLHVTDRPLSSDRRQRIHSRMMSLAQSVVYGGATDSDAAMDREPGASVANGSTSSTNNDASHSSLSSGTTQVISDMVVPKVVVSTNPAHAILRASQDHDLVVMYTRRRRSHVGEMRISNLSQQLVRKIQCSLVLLGEPKQTSDRRPSPTTQSLLNRIKMPASV